MRGRLLRRFLSIKNASPEYDYVVVGGGSSGCVVANKLSENPNLKVLLLEAGKSDNYVWIKIPVGYMYCIDNPRTDWCYKTQSEVGLNGRTLLYPRGKVLGGCSSINGMIYMRGQKEDYNNWANETNDEGWSWDNMLPLFKGMEDFHSGSNAWHGAGGPWRIEKQRLQWKVLDVFQQAAVEHGIPRTEDFNTGDNFGVGYFDVTQVDGWRLNANQAFIKPIIARKNLDVILDSQVDQLLFDDDNENVGGKKSFRCTGVSLARRKDEKVGKKIKTRVGGEVILTAGAIGSVQILERSGIGGGEHLTKLGIKVRSDLPGVGESLQDHLQIRFVTRY